MRNIKLAVALVAVLFGLAGIAYWDDQKTAEDKIKEKKDKLVFDFKKEDAQAVSYFRKDGDKTVELTLTKVDNKWRFETPLAGSPADDNIVNAMLGSFSTLKYSSIVSEDKSKWAVYGLDPATLAVSITLKAGETRDFVLGKKAPAGFKLYLGEKKSGKVYYTSQSVLSSSTKSLFDFRNKSIADFPPNDLEGLTIVNGKKSVAANKMNETEWTVSYDGMTKPADEFAIKDILASINNEKAIAITDQPTKKFKKNVLEKGTKVVLQIKKQKVPLFFANIDGGNWMLHEGDNIAYKLGDDFLEKINKTPGELRKKRIFNIETDKINQVKIDGTVYDKKDKVWTKAADPDKEQTHILTLLSDIKYLDAESFFDKAPEVTKAPPLHTITLNRDDKTSLKLSIWTSRKESESVVIFNPSTKEYYKIKATILSSLAEPIQSSEQNSKQNSEQNKDSADKDKSANKL